LSDEENREIFFCKNEKFKVRTYMPNAYKTAPADRIKNSANLGLEEKTKTRKKRKTIKNGISSCKSINQFLMIA